jgi:hypothetical protein
MEMKNRVLQTELEIVHQAFFERPRTMKEVDTKTGVMRESICWYCRALRKTGRLFRVRKRKCTVTGHNYVWEWTTNPRLKIDDGQLRLF